MKYVYSVLIIVIGFFAIPAVFDFSGNVADHLRLRGKDADDVVSPTSYNRRIQQDEAKAVTPISKPTSVRYIKE